MARPVDERLKLVRQSKDQFNQLRASLNRPELTDWNIRVRLMIEKLGTMPKTRGARREAWVEFPEHAMGEPRRAVWNLTDRSDYGIARMAIIHSRASLHSIDRYFMQLRRLLSLLERPISTPATPGASGAATVLIDQSRSSNSSTSTASTTTTSQRVRTRRRRRCASA
jgi:hypothetical protein